MAAIQNMQNAVALDAFVARLKQASADVDDISAIEVSRLLDRAVDNIRELRQRAGSEVEPRKDALIYLRTASAGASRIDREE